MHERRRREAGVPRTARLAVGGPAGETIDFGADHKFSPLGTHATYCNTAVCTEMPAPPTGRALLLGRDYSFTSVFSPTRKAATTISHHADVPPALGWRAAIRARSQPSGAGAADTLVATRHSDVRLWPSEAHDTRCLATDGGLGRVSTAGVEASVRQREDLRRRCRGGGAAGMPRPRLANRILGLRHGRLRCRLLPLFLPPVVYRRCLLRRRRLTNTSVIL